MDMHFYWVRDRFKQKHFELFWKLGVSNLGGYFTKHHLPEHHKGVIPVYLHCPKIRQDSARVFYYRRTSNMTEVEPMTTGVYNNTEAQSGACTKSRRDTNQAQHETCSSPRRTFFLHALSFECTSKLCIPFLNQFSVYFHILKCTT